MQEGGENNSPRWFLIMLGQIGSGPAIWFPSMGRTDPSPALLAGLVPAHDKTDFVWAEIDQMPLGPRSAQHILGLSPAQFVGPAQPNPIIYYILCILYCVLHYLYLDIYIEKLINFFENYSKKYVIFCKFITVF
jgi:hypothetical protein